MQSEIKICKIDFCKLRECEIKNSSKSVLQILLKFWFWTRLPQQINCENFIIGCMVGFRAIFDQGQVFTTLDENWIVHALYWSPRSCDAMHRMLESKSKLELFHRMFIKLLFHIFLALGLNTCLNGVCNYRYIYQSNWTPFKCWSCFCYFLRLLASFLHAWQMLTCGRVS